MFSFLNISTKRVGGLRFIKIGRLTLTISISKAVKTDRQIAREKAKRKFAREIRQLEAKRLRRLEWIIDQQEANKRLDAMMAERAMLDSIEDRIIADLIETEWEPLEDFIPESRAH